MFALNDGPDHGRPLAPDDRHLLAHGTAPVRDYLAFQGHPEPTPLLALPALAAQYGLGAILVKDESHRLGLGSFKALGGAYAVCRLVLEAAGCTETTPFATLDTPSLRALAAGMTFACATDGNHGRSVAQGATRLGARAVVFVHAGVSLARRGAMARLGAEIRIVAGTYDDSVAQSFRVAADEGWTLVSDTSFEGYERIPGIVMQGYTAIADETLDQLAKPVTHVFLQAGVGGFAAAMAGAMGLRLGRGRPRVIVVEPSAAACLMASHRAGRPIDVAPERATIMAMLECYAPSHRACRILARSADAFLAVDDDTAVAAMRRLAHPFSGDPAIISGESGAAGLAGLMTALAAPAIRQALALDGTSRILVVNTEGATDPALYARLVGSARSNTAGERA